MSSHELEGKTIDIRYVKNNNRVEKLTLSDVKYHNHELVIVDTTTDEIVEVDWIAQRTLAFVQQAKLIPPNRKPAYRGYYEAYSQKGAVWFWENKDGAFVGMPGEIESDLWPIG